MKKRRENALEGYSPTLTANALLETSAQTLINFIMALTGGFVMAAKE